MIRKSMPMHFLIFLLPLVLNYLFLYEKILVESRWVYNFLIDNLNQYLEICREYVLVENFSKIYDVIWWPVIWCHNWNERNVFVLCNRRYSLVQHECWIANTPPYEKIIWFDFVYLNLWFNSNHFTQKILLLWKKSRFIQNFLMLTNIYVGLLSSYCKIFLL